MFRTHLVRIVATITLSAVPFSASAFGISPSDITVTLRPGEELTQKYYVSRNPDKEGAMTATATPEVASLESWLTIPATDSILIPEGEAFGEYTLTFDTTGMEEGEYEEGIIFKTDPTLEKNVTGIGIAAGVQSNIKLTIDADYTPPVILNTTDDLEDVATRISVDETIQIAPALDDAEYPLSASLVVTNTGDLDIQDIPYQISFYTEERLVTQSGGTIGEIIAGADSTISALYSPTTPEDADGIYAIATILHGTSHEITRESTNAVAEPTHNLPTITTTTYVPQEKNPALPYLGGLIMVLGAITITLTWRLRAATQSKKK